MGIFCLAVLIRLTLFGVFAQRAGSFDFILGPQDTYGFINDGRNLYSGHGFSDVASPPFTPDGVRVPVVGIILGLFGTHYGWYVILQIVIASLTCVLLADLGARFFGRKIGLWAGGLLAFDPLVVFHSQQILSETWFAFFLVIAVWLLARFWEGGKRSLPWLAGSAAALGVATLTRPVGMVLLLFFLLALCFAAGIAWRRRLLNVLVFGAIVAVVVSPWLWRNHTTFGVWGLSYIPAYNWYHFNARVFYAKLNNISKDEAKSLFNAKAAAERESRQISNEFQMQDFYVREAQAVIGKAPAKYLVFHGLNTAAVLFAGTFDDLQKALDPTFKDVDVTSYVWGGWPGIKKLARDHPGLFAEKSGLLVCYLVVLCGFLLSFREREMSRRFVFLAVLALLLAATTGAVAEGRFRVPAEPFIVLLLVQSFAILIKAAFPVHYENSALRRDIPA